MKKLAQAGLLLALIGFISNAKAALLIEPVVGYNLKTNATFTEPAGDSYDKGKGPAYGGRLGYQQLGFQLGLDYLHSTLDMDDKADFTDDVTVSEWAAFVGFEFPVLFRVYAGYMFSVEGETEFQNVKTDLEKGSGMKLGVGFTGLPFVDINLEYRKGSYKEYTVDGVGTTKEAVDFSAIMLGLSLPFTI